jgi:hypothetical protein
LRIGGHAKIVVATLILAAGGLCGPFYVPVFFWGLMPRLILILLLFVVGIVVVVLLNKFLCKGPLRDRVGSVIGWVAVVGGSMILSAILGMTVTRGLIHLEFVEAQRYVAKAEIVLDSIKAQAGAYPKTLPVDKLGPLPIKLTYGTTDGKIGGFLYFDEDQEGIFTYDCGTKTWHYETGSGF